MGAVTKIWDATVEVERDGDIRSSLLTVNTSLSVSDMTSSVITLCKEFFERWSNLEDSKFTVERVSGGITNLLLKVSAEKEGRNVESVTVRLYGPNTEYVINRQRELHAIKYLSAAGFGAKLLAVFGNGMVQSFIDARTLTPAGCLALSGSATTECDFALRKLLFVDHSVSKDMKQSKVAAEIAKELHRFHQMDIPGSKEPQLWNDMFKFYEKASDLTFDDSEKKQKYETISFKEIHDELFELKELTCSLNAPVVFAHNDLLCGNIMFNEEEEKLYFIDFEYGSYNYRGYDIGNHFNEYAGYDCDYTLYPSKDEQYHFLRHYLPSGNVTYKDIEALHIETNTYMLASHLYWALWALIQAKMSPIDFDYLEYFFLRYNEYKKQKPSCLSLAKSYLQAS